LKEKNLEGVFYVHEAEDLRSLILIVITEASVNAY